MRPGGRIITVADIGSNTVKCSVFHISDGRAREICSDSVKLGIIARIRDNRLSREDAGDLCGTLAGFKEMGERAAAETGASDAVFLPFATASLRAADNVDEINALALGAVGTEITVLSEENEAAAAFDGFRYLNPGVRRGVMADMGGGSTELVAFDADGILKSCSMGFGCLSLFVRFVSGDFPSPDEENKITEYVTGQVAQHGFAGIGGKLCIIGGTSKAIHTLMKRSGICDSRKLTPEVLEILRRRLALRDPEDIALIEKLVPTRRETVIPGLAAYCAIARATDAKSVVMAKGGLREGIISRILRGELKC